MPDTIPPNSAPARHATESSAVEELDVILRHGMTCLMVDLGNRCGFWDVLDTEARTSEHLAARIQGEPRYFYEWLGAVVSAGLVVLDAEDRYRLMPEYKAALSRRSDTSVADTAGLVVELAHHVPRVAEHVRTGGGISYANRHPGVSEVFDRLNKNVYDTSLHQILELVPGLQEVLEYGTVADIGCGTGRVVRLLAERHPNGTFIGYDNLPASIEAARAEAQMSGLENVRFEVGDIGDIAAPTMCDAVLAFEVIHNLSRPHATVERVHTMLRPGGLFVMYEANASGDLQLDKGLSWASDLYAFSTLSCVGVSLAEGGPGLGAMWGNTGATALLADHGFSPVRVDVVPSDTSRALFSARALPLGVGGAVSFRSPSGETSVESHG